MHASLYLFFIYIYTKFVCTAIITPHRTLTAQLSSRNFRIHQILQ